MSVLNSLIKAAANNLIREKPELLPKIAKLLTKLLAENNGFTGVIEKFENHNLGYIINSWMSEEESIPISAEQLEQIFGQDFLSQLANKADINSTIFNMLLTQNLPQLVEILTQKGQIKPHDVPTMTQERAQELVTHFLS